MDDIASNSDTSSAPPELSPEKRWYKPWTWLSRPWSGRVMTALAVIVTLVLVYKGYQKGSAYAQRVVTQKAESIGFSFSMANPPKWMDKAQVAEIRAQIEKFSNHDMATYRRFQDPFDQDILQTVRDYYTSKNFAGVNRQAVGPNAWIKTVIEVRRVVRADRSQQWIEIEAEYRKPAAVVAVPYGVDGKRLTDLRQIADPATAPQMRYYLVDNQQVRLPGEFTKNVYGANFMTLYGVDQDVPAPGSAWTAPEMIEGLKLAAAIHPQPYASQIAFINLTNFGGRAVQNLPSEAGSAQISFVTIWGTRVFWGRPLGGEGLIEVIPAKKITTLSAVYAKFKRIDAERDWIDVRYDDPKVNVMTPPEPTPPNGTRRRARA